MNIEAIRESWKKYIAEIEAHQKAACLFTVKADTESGLSIGYDLALNRDALENTAKSIRNALVNHARKTFSPSELAPIVIDSDEVYEKFSTRFHHESKPEDFDPAALWAYLEKTYGQAPDDNAFKAVANALITAFGLRRNPEIKIKAGCSILEHHVYLDDFDKKNYGTNRLDYNQLNSFEKTLTSLKAFLEWAGEQAVMNDVFKHQNRIRNTAHKENHIISREKISFGDAIQLITFNTRFEYRFQPAIAQQLQLFLMQYGDMTERY